MTALNGRNAALASEVKALRDENARLRRTIFELKVKFGARVTATGETRHSDPARPAPAEPAASTPKPVLPAPGGINARHRSEVFDLPPRDPWDDMAKRHARPPAGALPDEDGGGPARTTDRRRQEATLERLFSPRARARLRANRFVLPGRDPGQGIEETVGPETEEADFDEAHNPSPAPFR